MTEKRPDTVAVIIVNYNGGELLQTCIDHLRHQTHAPSEILIVDNNSSDGSVDRLDLQGLPNSRLIRLDDNVGFARANNIAAKEATSEWLALLNPDTEAEPDWLMQLMEATRRHPNTSMFASTQLCAEDATILDGAGDSYFFLGIPWRGGFGRPASELPEEGECFSPSGASALFHRSVYIDAGGLDESYFCYCEDVDLGFRLRLQGERCMFVPSAVIRHHGSAITGRYSDFTVRFGTRNRTRTYLSNMPPIALWLTLPGHLLASLYLYLRAIGKPHAKAMRQGIFQALGALPDILKRRQEVQASRRLSSLEISKAMSFNPATLHQRKPHVWQAEEPPLRSPRTNK